MVLCPSHSVLEVYAGRHLYVVYMNNMIHEIKSTQLCSMIYTDKHLYDKKSNNEQEESTLSLESNHMPLNGNWFSHLC